MKGEPTEHDHLRQLQRALDQRHRELDDQLRSDMRLYGTAAIRHNKDGSIERIDPRDMTLDRALASDTLDQQEEPPNDQSR